MKAKILESALQSARHIHHPVASVAFALAFRRAVLHTAIRSRKYRTILNLRYCDRLPRTCSAARIYDSAS
jgi:hypothetical protein